ncbi:MAG: nucleotidyltransferase domain-containing protein [Corynebacteriales bacterium]|nr:nucleotidyltransferase domain-containing protein [Mycobacteriales bacterium]
MDSHHEASELAQALSPSDDAASGQERWQLAQNVTDFATRRFPADVLAVGVHGPLAHGDIREGTDINVVIVTYRSGRGLASSVRQIDGWIVNMSVFSADEYMRAAQTLEIGWPLIADQFLNAKALFDQAGFYQQLRDTHLSRLASAGSREFSALARQAWCEAASLHRRAARSSEWFDSDGALMLLAQARAQTAIVDGLMSRTYFRGSADAGRRTGVSGLDLQALGERLSQQAATLSDRGQPVDASIAELFA